LEDCYVNKPDGNFFKERLDSSLSADYSAVAGILGLSATTEGLIEANHGLVAFEFG
jgi:hypothetical protein